MQAPKVFKSLAELPADAWAMASSLPVRAVRASRQVAGPPVRLARRTLTAANRQSREALDGMYGHAKSALRLAQPWTRGGLNE